MKKGFFAEEIENVERWVVSYADFITLLFAFFTAMYAISNVDKQKLEQFSGSMKKAFKSEQVIEGTGIGDGSFQSSYIEMELRKLLPQIMPENAYLSKDSRGIVVSLGDVIIFEPGSTEIKKEGIEKLREIALLLKKLPNSIIIEGHTDNIPLTGKEGSIKNNWQLSALRAAKVLEIFIKDFRFPPERLSVAGYGEYKPLMSNDTPSGRARNRRVDIIVVIGNNSYEKRND